MSSTAVIVVIVVVVIVLLALVAVASVAIGRRRSQRLQERFGPEYEHQIEETGDPAATERELAAREKRHRSLPLRTLDAGERDAFAHRWEDVRREFVDDPDRAVADADALVDDVLNARGYPEGDTDQRVADVSVEHPAAVQRYREARRIAAGRDGLADTEALRGAVTAYGELVEALLGGRATDRAESGAAPGATPGTAPTNTTDTRATTAHTDERRTTR